MRGHASFGCTTNVICSLLSVVRQRYLCTVCILTMHTSHTDNAVGSKGCVLAAMAREYHSECRSFFLVAALDLRGKDSTSSSNTAGTVEIAGTVEVSKLPS